MSYQAKFLNISEIRMGSPYNVADLILEGGFVPEFGEKTFQDIFLLAEGGEVIYLVNWQHEKNSPGFVVNRLDNRTKTWTHSSRVPGCCKTLYWHGSQLMAEVFEYPESKKIQILF